MRRVFVHCGLHKTGTTALQQVLLALAAVLHEHGILFPRAGRLDHFGGGHHNAAWHLTRDRRYDDVHGRFDSLLDEIAAFDGDTVLSSEDFETCLGAPALFAPLVEDARLRDRRFVFVIYLREQVGYAESLFFENLGHGIADTCLAVMREIQQRQCLAVWEWRFQFDYLNILRAMPAGGRCEVIFRPYEALLDNSIVPDFFAVLMPGYWIRTDQLPRANPRWTFLEALALFYHNRVDRRALTPAELTAVRLLAAEAGDQRPRLATGIRHALAETFARSNQMLCREVGLSPDSLTPDADTPAADGTCFMDRVFSLQTQFAIATLATLIPESGPDPLPAPDLSLTARSLLAEVAADWRRDRAAL